jgi:hypothetical protein
VKQFAVKHATTIGIVVSLVGTLWGAFETLLNSGKPVTAAAVVAVLGPALVGWLMKRPGDLTKSQAEKLADQRASEALRSVSMYDQRGGD